MCKNLKLIFTIIATALLTSCAKTSSTSIASVSAPNTTNTMALRIYQALPIYAKAAKIHWQPIQKNNIQFDSIVRERLTALNMMQSDSLSAGIREFQLCNGLKQTGVINSETLAALNITPAERYHELVHSMHEWEKYPENQNSRYIQVNIPNYTMHVISNGDNVLQMKVIVGRPSRPTPLLTSKVSTIVFNPTWTVPKTILSKDVIPGMRENPNYLKEHYDMHVYANYDKNAPEINPAIIDWKTANLSNFNYRVMAPAGEKNPLGRVKFIFENDHDVYMHDTPEKSLFALTARDRSSGCIRLENPMALVEYFYADNNDLNAEWVSQYLSTMQTKYIQLRHAIPVYITYILAWVDENGRVHFGRDVYKNNSDELENKSSIA